MQDSLRNAGILDLRASFLTMVDAVPLPQVLIGHDERVIVMNDGARRLFGEKLVGRHYITALRQPAILDSVEAVLRDRAVRAASYMATYAGRDATYVATVGPIALGGGFGALITLEDRTAVDEAGQMRRDFVANVSHELRTPLTALLGLIETLRAAAREDRHAREKFLATMEREAGRMNRLVHDLLSLSRVESEERLRPTDEVDLGSVLESVLSSLRGLAEARGANVRVSFPTDPVRVGGDADQLFQVFSNLAENALKYGGGEVEIAVCVNQRDQALREPAVRIAVRDQGDGIDPMHLPRLTERFYRVDTHRSREMGGTGLGLAIVKHIVNRHRGRLRVESEPGAGSTFTVVLPLSRD